MAGRPLTAPAAPATPATLMGRRAAAACGAAVVLLLGVGVGGPSAAVPSLGPSSAGPPWSLDVHPAPGLVVGMLVAAYLLGGAGVWWGLRAVGAGWRPSPRGVATAAVLAVGALIVVPPFGSADHLSYAAYGRIAAQGGDPYLVPPDRWGSGLDPVASAAQAPWRDTVSVYGPVATGVQTVTSLLGGSSLRWTVWYWQLVAGGCFLLTSWVLDRMAGRGPAARARVAVLWTLNPLMLGPLVGGAHLDVVSTAAAMTGILLATSSGARGHLAAVPGTALNLLAGAAIGVAAGTKLPYAVAGGAVVWALRRRRRADVCRAVAAGLVGAGAVLVPAHLWAGTHVYQGILHAGRLTSLATVWRPVLDGVQVVTGRDVRDAVPVLSAVLAGMVLLALVGMVRRAGVADGSGPRDRWPSQDPAHGAQVAAARVDAARALLLLATAYLLASAYVLPWYDAMGWAPLAVAGAGIGLDGALLARLTALSLAYVPGVVGPPSAAATLMLDLRRYVAPAFTGGVLLWVLGRGLTRLRDREDGSAAGRRGRGGRPWCR